MSAHATLNTDERAALLKMAGITDELATQLDTPVIDEEPDLDTLAQQLDTPTTIVTTAMVEGRNPVAIALDGESVTMIADVVKDILTKAHGSKDKALALCDAYAKAEFDRIKLGKIQAAAKGLTPEGKTEHNKAAWAHCKNVGDQLKTQVRKHFRETGGFVQAKISKAKQAKPSPELDAFLLEHQDNPVLAQFLALQQGK